MYEFKDNTLYENPYDVIVSPSEIQSTLATMFGIESDLSYLIVYEWLYDNGYQNISLNWYGNISYNGPSLFDNTVYGDNSSIVIGQNTVVGGSNNIVIGSNNTIAIGYQADLTTSVVSPNIFIEGTMTTSSSPDWNTITTSEYLHRMCNE
jgi:hypothetical protein